MKKPQVMRPGRVHTSQAAPSTTRTPAIVSSTMTRSSRRLVGRGSAMSLTSCRACSGDGAKIRVASRPGRDVGDAAPLRQQTGADVGVDRRAAHRGEVEPIARAQARTPGGRIVLVFERTLDVVNPPVAVHCQTERAQRTNDPKHIRDDHRERIDGQKQEGDAAEEARALTGHDHQLREARRATSFMSAEERKLPAAQVFVHKPRRVVAIREGIARVIRNRAGKAYNRASDRGLPPRRQRCRASGAIGPLWPRVVRSPASAPGRRRRGERPDRPALSKPRRDGACSASNRDRAAPCRRYAPPRVATRTSFAAGRVRRGDPVQPVRARFAPLERHNEADARALVHASLQDLGEPIDGFGERGGLERGDTYRWGFHDLTEERECSAPREAQSPRNGSGPSACSEGSRRRAGDGWSPRRSVPKRRP